MSTHDACACNEYNELSRRHFLGTTGGVALAALLPTWLPRVAYAEDDCSTRDVIISIYLRGGLDGLSMAPPFLEPDYYASRPTLAVPPPDAGNPNAALNLDGFFGFAPSMAGLMPAYQAGELLVVHATGSTDPSRSHFDAQRYMEVGKPADPEIFTGWLGRHLLSSTPISQAAVLRAVGIATGLQRTLVGGPATLPIPDLDKFGLGGSSSTAQKRLDALNDMYQWVQDPLKAAADTTQLTVDLLDQINFAGYVPKGGASYPSGGFGTALKSSAALIKAQVGVEAIAIDLGGWDLHAALGIFDGSMASLMTTLSQGLGALHADLHGDAPNVTVVCMSEFGRRLKENGSFGTDHGHGNVMLLMGEHVQGGRVLSEWPGLAPEQLFEGKDLEVTIDFRDVLGEVVARRLGNQNLGYVFPDYTPTFRGVVQPCMSKRAQP